MIIRSWSAGRRALLTGALAAATAAAAAGAAGCGGDVKQQIETGYNEGSVSVLGKTAIERAAGVKISGELSCKVPQTVPASGAMPVNCTGKTQDDRAVTLTGTASKVSNKQMKADRAQGNFSATVGGDQVFTTTCLGRC